MHKRSVAISMVLALGAHFAATTSAWPQAPSAPVRGRELTFSGPKGGPFSPSPLMVQHTAHEAPCPFMYTSSASWVAVWAHGG